MSTVDFLLELYVVIDEDLNDIMPPEGLRQRGPAPTLSDAEAITIAVAGEFMGLDTDKHIYQHFRRYHRAEFPALAQVSRTSFARQVANLWRVIEILQERLLGHLPLSDPLLGSPLWLIDSFPLRVCRLARAPGCKRFGGLASFGHDPTAGRDCFYGFRVHLRCASQGACAQIAVAPGHVQDVPMLAELTLAPGQQGIADRNYWSPETQAALERRGFHLLAPFKKVSSDPWPKHSALLARLRQPIEVVIGQLAQRFHIETTWAKDLWHLCGRLARKILSHTAARFLNWRHGHPPLQFDLLLDA